MRLQGDRSLEAFLKSEVGHTRQVLVESNGRGHTQHFAPVVFDHPPAVGSIVEAVNHCRRSAASAGAAGRMSFFKKMFTRALRRHRYRRLRRRPMNESTAATAELSGEPARHEPAAGASPAPPRKWFERLRQGMAKSSKSLTSGITDIFTKRRLDAATLEELEEVLIRADLGPAAAARIAGAVGEGRYDRDVDPEEVKRILAAQVAKLLSPAEVAFRFDEARKPFVILVVGVNGSGQDDDDRQARRHCPPRRFLGGVCRL